MVMGCIAAWMIEGRMERTARAMDAVENFMICWINYQLLRPLPRNKIVKFKEYELVTVDENQNIKCKRETRIEKERRPVVVLSFPSMGSLFWCLNRVCLNEREVKNLTKRRFFLRSNVSLTLLAVAYFVWNGVGWGYLLGKNSRSSLKPNKKLCQDISHSLLEYCKRQYGRDQGCRGHLMGLWPLTILQKVVFCMNWTPSQVIPFLN